jgi:predicted GNAT family N-acyltransferase
VIKVEDFCNKLPDSQSLEAALSSGSLTSDLQALGNHQVGRDRRGVGASPSGAAAKGKRIFISYAHEDDDYKARVRLLAERLTTDGLDVRLDQWHLMAGRDLVEFMSHEIRHADYVLVLCSPKFASKSLEAEEGQGPSGLVWEKRLITTLMERDPKRVIPVLGRGTWAMSAPSFFQGLLYIDLSNRDIFERAYGDLYGRLLGSAEPVPPVRPTATRTDSRDVTPHLPWPTCRIVIACARPAVRSERLRLIKKWLNEKARCGANMRPIHFSLASAAESAGREPTVLLALGFSTQEIQAAFPEGAGRNNLDIVCLPSSIPQREVPTPSASLVDPTVAVSVAGADPIPFVRKALLRSCARQAVSVRHIQTEQELEEYFVLRYNVWKEMGYLAGDDGSLETPWDVNYTDRTSVALGAYAHGKLVACARLVYGLGEEDRAVVAMMEQLLSAKGGTSLARRLTIPPGMPPQFDILGAFRGFPAYYRQLVTDKVAKAEVSRVIVEAKYRQHGLGEVVVDSLSALAERRKLDLLFLACRQSHRPFYERCGFQAIPDMVCDRFVNHDEPSIAMERHLGGTRGY